MPAVMWFRRDLRLDDNPALAAAAAASENNVICLYILEDQSDGRGPGGASKWWLDKSLRALAAEIKNTAERSSCARAQQNPFCRM